MCGIAGIVTAHDGIGDIESRAAAMMRALGHRGPDDQGLFVSPNHDVALAHTRLSILDLSEAGKQPMTGVGTRYRIVFNGEIYNFRELREELEAAGCRFKTQTDTEIILALYERHGERCVEQLRGMFAFAIYDEEERGIFLARDGFGIKPLYVCEKNGALIFASELRALLACGLVDRVLDPEGLFGYFVSGSVQEPHTMVRGVRAMEPGTWLQWKNGHGHTGHFWQINFTPEEMSRSEAIDRTRAALLDSIAHHFVSDVPVGIFLSGGVDSTAILALARASQTNTLRTYSIAFEEDDVNEGPVARRTAEHFETDHYEHLITEAEGRSLMATFREHVDQPTIDGFNSYCVSKVARDHGTKVCLSGLGGDEFFNGYPSFRKIQRLLDLRRRINIFNGIVTAAGRSLEMFSPWPKHRRIGTFLQRPGNATSAGQLIRSVFSFREALLLTEHFTGSQVDPQSLLASETQNFPTLLDEISHFEATRYMRNQLLRDSDVMSMAVGLELRVPFVDRELFEAIAVIPAEHRLAPGKELLIRAVPEIPDWVARRPKSGFLFPFQRWFDNGWSREFGRTGEQLGIPMSTWYRRWSTGLLEWWINCYIAQIPTAA